MSLLTALLEEGLASTMLPSPRNEVWIATRSDASMGDGSRDNPLNGTLDFDAAMRSIGSNTDIHIGPGTFRTRGGPGAGYALSAKGFQIQKGQRIIGSGMFSTILRFFWTDPIGTSSERHNILSHIDQFADDGTFITNFEVSDLTLDCRLQDFENTTKIATCAILATGDHILVRRVRVINFGTRTPLQENGASVPEPPGGLEGFPIRVGGRARRRNPPGAGYWRSLNAVLEDCVIEQPYATSGREVTILMGGGVSNDASPAEALHWQPMASVARRNYINFG